MRTNTENGQWKTGSSATGDRDNDSNPGTASTRFDPKGNTTNYGGTFQYDVENRLTNANNGAVLLPP